MSDPTKTPSLDRVSAAAWAGRLVLAICIFGAALIILFLPMWQSGHLKVQLGLACSNMTAHMRQQPTSNAGFALAVAQPECWPTAANMRSAP
jgi:hypothetical protein